jgi:hypothetical protein
MKRRLGLLLFAIFTLTMGWRPAYGSDVSRTSAPYLAQIVTTATPGPAGNVPAPAAPAPAAPANEAPVAPVDEGDGTEAKPWWRLVFIIPVALVAGAGAMWARQRARERGWAE